jgi:predicted nucleotidyltransferase
MQERTKDPSLVISYIQQVAREVLPKGSTLYLYGSRARGDYHEDSDWDLLLLLDKPNINYKEREAMEYPFTDMGWDIGEDINVRAYTNTQWFKGIHTMFYYNVEEDKKLLYES